jgi:hypothetical protein
MVCGQETTFSIRFKEDSTLAMSYSRLTLAVLINNIRIIMSSSCIGKTYGDNIGADSAK